MVDFDNGVEEVEVSVFKTTVNNCNFSCFRMPSTVSSMKRTRGATHLISMRVNSKSRFGKVFYYLPFLKYFSIKKQSYSNDFLGN